MKRSLRSPPDVRCFDDGGKTVSRYTAVFTARWEGDGFVSLSLDETCATVVINAGTYTGSHLGTKIAFHKLPENVRTVIVEHCRRGRRAERAALAVRYPDADDNDRRDALPSTVRTGNSNAGGDKIDVTIKLTPK
jgi:hypothetical protein